MISLPGHPQHRAAAGQKDLALLRDRPAKQGEAVAPLIPDAKGQGIA
jgi:hypothetical protein